MVRLNVGEARDSHDAVKYRPTYYCMSTVDLFNIVEKSHALSESNDCANYYYDRRCRLPVKLFTGSTPLSALNNVCGMRFKGVDLSAAVGCRAQVSQMLCLPRIQNPR